MNKRVKIVLLLLTIGALFITTNITYSKYVFIRNFDATVSSQPFYFEAIPESDNIVFPRTPDESDTDIIRRLLLLISILKIMTTRILIHLILPIPFPLSIIRNSHLLKEIPLRRQ